MDFGKGK